MDKLREEIAQKIAWEVWGEQIPTPKDYKLADELFSLIRQHKIEEQIEEAEYVARLIDRGWIPPEKAQMKPPEDKDGYLTCPFCSENGFDKLGLKGHLERLGWCEKIGEVKE